MNPTVNPYSQKPMAPKASMGSKSHKDGRKKPKRTKAIPVSHVMRVSTGEDNSNTRNRKIAAAMAKKHSKPVNMWMNIGMDPGDI